MKRHVTVATVTYNSADTLPEFIAALPAGLAGLSYDLVVADNASTDESRTVVGRLAPDATVLALSENRGYAAGVNAAIAAGPDSDAVLVVNPDVRLGPGSVTRLVAALDEPGVGISAPRLVDEAGRLQYSLRRDATLGRAFGEALLGGTRARRYPALSQVVGDTACYDHPHDVDWASGALLAISRRCVDTCGPWDESFFLYCEEEEFEMRARRLGFRVRYVPGAHAVHIGGDMHRLPRLWAVGRVNSLRLYSRSHRRVATEAYRAALVCNEALRSRDTTHRRALQALLARDAVATSGHDVSVRYTAT